jgi:hypothetical protein
MASPSPYKLQITSHGRTFGPLSPAPSILINLTSLPNPHVQLRKKYLGSSARLRKEFFGDEKARQALERSVVEIEECMRQFEGPKVGNEDSELRREGDDVGDVGLEASQEGQEDLINGKGHEVEDDGEGLDEDGVEREEIVLHEDEDGEKGNEDEDWEDDSDIKVLRVGVQCEMGRHRSVAMAEELGRRLDGRKRWTVEVEHRDIGNKRGKGVGSGGKGGKGRGKEKWGEERRRRRFDGGGDGEGE